MAVVVTVASCSDPAGARLLLRRLGGACKKLHVSWGDGAYRGQVVEWVQARFWFRFQPVLRSDSQKGFLVVPRRWLIERTWAWLNQSRRLSKDYEVLSASSGHDLPRDDSLEVEAMGSGLTFPYLLSSTLSI